MVWFQPPQPEEMLVTSEGTPGFLGTLVKGSCLVFLESRSFFTHLVYRESVCFFAGFSSTAGKTRPILFTYHICILLEYSFSIALTKTSFIYGEHVAFHVSSVLSPRVEILWSLSILSMHWKRSLPLADRSHIKVDPWVYLFQKKVEYYLEVGLLFWETDAFK